MKEINTFQHYTNDRQGRLLERDSNVESEERFYIEGCVPISNLIDILDTLNVPTGIIVTAHQQINEFIFTGGGIAHGYPVYKGDPENLTGVRFQTTHRTGKIPVTGVILNSRLMRNQIVNKLDPDIARELLGKEKLGVYFILPHAPIIITPVYADGNTAFSYDPVIPYISTLMNNVMDNFEIMTNRHRTAHGDPTQQLLSDRDLVRSSLTEIAIQQTQSPHTSP